MRKVEGRTAELTRHFFRRFFENDVIQSSGDTITTVVRAISIVAAPGLMFGFFLQTQYPQRPLWGRIEDEYFYVLFAFVAMAGVAVFEWEMLFPDRLDFLVLGPLSLKPLQMLAAKGTALGLFLGLFLLASNAFGTVVMPMLNAGGHFMRVAGAHAVAVMMAGVFGATLIAGLGGLLLCVLPARLFRMVSPLMQMLTVAVLALMLIHYARFGDGIQAMLAEPFDAARWMPSFWFLGVYQRLLHGASAPAFAWPMARYAVWATCGAVALVLVTYPLAWVRMRRMAMEGVAHPQPDAYPPWLAPTPLQTRDSTSRSRAAHAQNPTHSHCPYPIQTTCRPPQPGRSNEPLESAECAHAQTAPLGRRWARPPAPSQSLYPRDRLPPPPSLRQRWDWSRRSSWGRCTSRAFPWWSCLRSRRSSIPAGHCLSASRRHSRRSRRFLSRVASDSPARPQTSAHAEIP